MKEKRLPKSIRKYIRKEKAKIRQAFSDLKEREEKIKILYQKIFTQFKKDLISKNNLKSG